MSGSTIGGVLGAAVGYWVGGARGAQVGWMVGSAAGGYVDPDVIAGQRLTDAQTQTVAEGAPRPIIFGTVVVAGNCIMAGPLDEHESKDRIGKGGSQVQQAFTYTRTYAIRVCEGPVGNISRIWRDDKLVYDVRDPAQWPDAADAIANLAGDTAKFASIITIYRGDESQLPDPSLEALPEENGGGVGEVNAHRGTCYVVFTDDDVTDNRGALPQYRFEVSRCGDATSTLFPIPWVHSDTGLEQPIYGAAVFGGLGFVAGQNDNLRRTTDGGHSWNAVDYLTSTGWGVGPLDAIFHMEDPGNSAGVWYVTQYNKVGVSYSAGFSFTHYLNTVHNMVTRNGPGGGVHIVGGIPWAGAQDTTNTVIFQPLELGSTDIDLGSDLGRATAIGDIGGAMFIGTSAGKICLPDGTVVYDNGATGEISQFAYGLGIGLAAQTSGGYNRTTDGGTSWANIASPDVDTVSGVVFARGLFYLMTIHKVYASATGDAGTWTEVDSSLNYPANGILASDGYSVLATTYNGNHTAMLPSIYAIPDIATGWHLDSLGNVVGDTTTAVDRCIADLEDVVLEIGERVDLWADKIDASALAGVSVRGFTIGQPMPANEAWRSLQQYYFFDMPEWGDSGDTATKLRAVPRGGPTLFDIPDDVLVESDEDDDGIRGQVLEFPRKVNLVTSDVDMDYNPTKQTFERRTDNIKAVGEASFTLSVVTLREEAARAVDIMGKVSWEEAMGRTRFTVPAEYARLTPSDRFTKGGRRWRAKRCEAVDGTVTVDAVRDRAAAYVSSATPSDAPLPSVPPSSLRGPTVFAAFNSPSLRSADSRPGIYVAGCGLLDGWIGYDLYMSVDGGLSEQFVRTITTAARMGTLAADCDAGTTDLMTVAMVPGAELDTVTPEQIAARANAFAVMTGAPGGEVAEIGQFMTATETATPDTYDLTDLTRGEPGTIAAPHYIGDRFVMLDGVDFIEIDASRAGQEIILRPVSRGTAPANNRTYTIVFDPPTFIVDGGEIT